MKRMSGELKYQAKVKTEEEENKWLRRPVNLKKPRKDSNQRDITERGLRATGNAAGSLNSHAKNPHQNSQIKFN